MELLELQGWITPSSDGGYLVREVELTPNTATSMLEAIWGDAHPVPTEPVERIVTVNPADLLTWPRPRTVVFPRSREYTTYLIGIESLPFVKIGHTRVNAKARMANLQCGLPLELTLLGFWAGDHESRLHARFDAYRVRGEWFDLSSLGDPVEVVQAAIDEIEAKG